MSDKLVPNDSRVKYETAQIRGKTYSYILGEPSGEPISTVVLVHGWPDIAFGWRCQVPYLMKLGFRVVVPNMLGYAGTDAPQALEEYSLKSLSADVAELSRKFVGEKGQIILGGHDWGGALVWRVALWHPELIKGVFSVCTPYNAPSKQHYRLEDIVATKVPNFTYQLHLRGPDVEEGIQGEEKIRQFLNGMYGGVGPNGELAFKVTEGVQLDNLHKLGPAKLLSKEELDHYVQQYMLRPERQLRGPLNWYRTREINFEEELPLAEKGVKLEMPALFVTATKDAALPPWMSAGMEDHFKQLSRAEVDSSHWALTQAGDAVNEHIGKWIDGVLGGAIKSSL